MSNVKRHERTHDERLTVITLRNTGMVFTEISRRTNIPLTTVKDICKSYLSSGKIDTLKRKGRHRLLDARAKRRLRRVVMRNRKKTLSEITKNSLLEWIRM